ncbi:hypothetical protein PSHT_07190 [Puccinia striiformis]|uniref:Integrase catalytic domain-containing protein n=1 Tax=Puccinia striiformis TaxID=27350 RepID=A0A2S4VZX3_9BASI|nr:hypothetical protein PSHT_07190 [Puccinia striiformis]
MSQTIPTKRKTPRTLADHPKIPGDFGLTTPEATPDPATDPTTGSSTEHEDKPLIQSRTSTPQSSHSNSTFQPNDLIPDSEHTSDDIIPETEPLISNSKMTTESTHKDPTSVKLCTEKLTAHNFDGWRYDMRNALSYMNLDAYITKSHTDKMKARPDYEDKLKQVTTYIRLHLTRAEATRFVDDLDVYDPKALWDSILAHYAEKSLENSASLMEKLYDMTFIEEEMLQCIENFRTTFKLMIEVSTGPDGFDKRTLDAIWVFFVLRRLPPSYTVFRTLQYSSWKRIHNEIVMTKFLSDLETELRRKLEAQSQSISSAAALAVYPSNQRNSNPKSTAPNQGSSNFNNPNRGSNRRPTCQNGVHNPATTHSEENCHQAHPEKALAYHQAAIDRMKANSSNRALLSVNSGISDAIVLDSGASGHYLKHREYFTSFSPTSLSVYGANGAAIPILGVGSAVIHASTGPIHISEAYFAPALSNSLIPLSFYIRLGYSINPTKNGNGFECQRNNQILCVGSTTDHVLLVQMNPLKALTVTPNYTPSGLLLHQALGHPSLPYLKKAFPDIRLEPFECPTCDVSKMHRTPFPSSFPVATRLLECIHMDLCGPITPISRGGNRYFLKIIDGYSKFRFIFPMRCKSTTFETFANFLHQAENSTGCKLVSVVSDNGGEFVNNRFKDFYSQHGVQHLTSAPYTPQQNPFAERGNRTTIEKARALLATSGLPLSWWGEAVTTSVYLENRSPDSSIKFASPYELWHGSPPDLSRLVPFGCRAVAYVEKHTRHSKFSPSGVEAIFLGYDEHHHSYKLWVPSTSKILITHHVKFSPMCFPSLTPSTAISSSEPTLFDFDLEEPIIIDSTTAPPADRFEEVPPDSLASLPAVPEASEPPPTTIQEHIPSSPSVQIPAPPPKGYAYVPDYGTAPKDINSSIDPANIIEGGRRPRAQVIRRHQANLIVGEPASLRDPKTYGEILGRLDEEHWLMAVEVEINNINRHEVWVVAPLTPGAKPLDTVWVFKRKFDADGDLLKYKARLCVRGFRQIEGTDYGATFAPTGRPATLRLVLGIGAIMDFEIHQMDVKCAFLNGVPDEDLFIKVPDGVGIELPPGHGLKLQKSLYGLKQSPRCWYRALKDFFVSINFKPATVDPCLFIHQDPNTFCCVYIHVDDLVIIGPQVQFFKDKIKARFEMEDLGECNWVLGMRVTRNREARTLTLSQDRYVREILEEFGMAECRSITSPLPTNAPTCPIDPLPPSTDFNFRRGVGLLSYLVQCTRPDLAFTCSYLSQFLNKPSKTHQNHFLHALRYLQHTKSHGITLGAVDNKPSQLVAYSDASHGSATQAHSFAGSALLHNGLVGWRCAKMDNDAPSLSTTESEYRACSETGQDIIWFQQLLDCLRPFLDLPENQVTLYCDNQGALALLKDTVYQHRTRHINIRYHWLRHHIEDSTTFTLTYIPTDKNVADFLTKPLSPIKTRAALENVSLSACEFTSNE